MRIRFLKSVASIFGGFAPGMVADIPNEAIAKSWCNAGIAEEVKGEAEVKVIKPRQIIKTKMPAVSKGEPETIPEGQFWCPKHQVLHKLTSSQGKRCLKRIGNEKKKAVEAKEAEAVEETGQ